MKAFVVLFFSLFLVLLVAVVSFALRWPWVQDHQFIVGGYVTGAVVAFLASGFFVVLSGRDAWLPIPFVFGLFWPVAIVLAVFPVGRRRCGWGF